MNLRSSKRKQQGDHSNPLNTKKPRNSNPIDQQQDSNPKPIINLNHTIRPYRRIQESAGNTYTIDATTPNIGTDGCFSCLGVYFALDAHRCFVAHINIDPLPPSGVRKPHADRRVEDNKVDVAAARAIVWWVKDKLNREAWEADWGPVTALMRSSLVAVCPNADFPGGTTTFVADAAFAGVKEFLGIHGVRRQPELAEGFVVTHTGKGRPEVALFPAERGLWEGVDEPFDLRVAPMGLKARRNGEKVLKGGRGKGKKHAQNGNGGGEKGMRPVWNWGWGDLRHDGRVLTQGVTARLEGPFHKDSA